MPYLGTYFTLSTIAQSVRPRVHGTAYVIYLLVLC